MIESLIQGYLAGVLTWDLFYFDVKTCLLQPVNEANLHVVLKVWKSYLTE